MKTITGVSKRNTERNRRRPGSFGIHRSGCAAAGFLLFLCISCSLQTVFNPDTGTTLERGIKIATWNTQTFFDANEEGTEFDEFKKKAGLWNEARYAERVKRLCSVIEKIGADIFTLQEIENEAVLRDISNSLSYKSGYEYAAFSREPGSAFGIGVLSKLPVESLKTHQITVQGAGEKKQPDMRPLSEARFVIKSAEGSVTLIVFSCHWKSKSGGETETEIWRVRQEALLAESAAKAKREADSSGKKSVIIAAGDFNRELREFSSKPGGKFVFSAEGLERIRAINRNTVPAAGTPPQNVIFLSPWNDYAQEGESGSYFYGGKWERIDHIFLAEAESGGPAVRLAQFTVEKTGAHATADGKPFRYNPASGAGYSDHFPLSALIIAEKQGK